MLLKLAENEGHTMVVFGLVPRENKDVVIVNLGIGRGTLANPYVITQYSL